MSFTVCFVFMGVIHWYFNYFSFSTAYLCDHWLHLFDFKCQTIGQMMAVTKLNIKKNKNTFLKQFQKQHLKHVIMRLKSPRLGISDPQSTSLFRTLSLHKNREGRSAVKNTLNKYTTKAKRARRRSITFLYWLITVCSHCIVEQIYTVSHKNVPLDSRS